jgi:hypothetical protein
MSGVSAQQEDTLSPLAKPILSLGPAPVEKLRHCVMALPQCNAPPKKNYAPANIFDGGTIHVVVNERGSGHLALDMSY